MYICFCTYARHTGFVHEVPKDSERDFIVHDTVFVLFSKRVCLRWNYLMKTGCLWKFIDLGQLLPCFRHRFFPQKQSLTLTFLETYGGLATKEIHLLDLANNDILQCIQDRCPNLEVIVLTLRLHHPKIDFSLLSSSLVSIDLRLPITGSSGEGTAISCFAEKPFQRLQYMFLQGAKITEGLFRRLRHSKNLRHLRLHHCACLTENNFQVMLRRLTLLEDIQLISCRFPSIDILEEILQIVANTFVNLQSFHFSSPYILGDIHFAQIDLDDFLKTISQHQKLRRLRLTSIFGFSASAFSTFARRLPNLIELCLASCPDVTDDIVCTIATELNNLETLELRCRFISDNGLKMLSYHPRVKNLNIADTPNFSISTITETVSTFPEITHLTMSRIKGSKACVEYLQRQKPDLKIQLVHIA